MSSYSKLHMLRDQPRSFIAGTVECIDSQWIFFEDQSDEAFMLDEIVDDTLEVYAYDSWQKAIFTSDNILQLNKQTYMLRHGDQIRVKKKLQHAYELLLESLSLEAFTKFANQLNSLDFSLYDCIYCHNTLCFLPADGEAEGVNFLVYDNEEYVCSVHHLFERGKNHLDRFEYTMNNGKRLMTIWLK